MSGAKTPTDSGGPSSICYGSWDGYKYVGWEEKYNAEAGKVAYEAFRDMNKIHNVSGIYDLPDPEITAQICLQVLRLNPEEKHTRAIVVLDRDEHVVGSTFVRVEGKVAGYGPITVAKSAWGKGIASRTLQLLMDYMDNEAKVQSHRLVQMIYNTMSYALYNKLGFDAQLQLLEVAGFFKPGSEEEIPRSIEVRDMTADDVEACANLCTAVIGHPKLDVIRYTVTDESPRVVAVEDGVVTAFTTAMFIGFSVAANQQALQAVLIGCSHRTAAHTAKDEPPPSFFVPARYNDLTRWLFSHGFKLHRHCTLMAKNEYMDPKAPHLYLPGIDW